jgi:hypothetical protein
MFRVHPAAGRMRRRFVRVCVALAAVAVFAAAVPAAALSGATDINPNSSDLDASDPDGASGGRMNGIGADPNNNQVFYGATEWGGIYKSTNGGLSWSHLDSHTPFATWDVAVDPANSQRVYATSFFDGRIPSGTRAGINVSSNGGSTWTHPATATPPANTSTYSCLAARRNEPAAFGIAIEPGAPQNVYVGTSCGLAISSDSGGSWSFVDPKRLTTPPSFGTAPRIWDVVAQAGGTLDVCGDEGHFRSTDRGATWTASTGLPTGTCSLAVSPDESYVLFAAASDNRFYETDNADAANPTWIARGSPEMRNTQGRINFVATNQRSNSGGNNVFDLWYGDVSLYRGGCTTPATRPSPDNGGSPRCPIGYTTLACSTCTPPITYASPPAGWAGPFTRSVGAHDDAGDIAFDVTQAVDACPDLFSSDGGVFYNTDNGSDCQNPDWEQPNTTPHATWLFAMDGVNRAGTASEDLAMGLQDDGFWISTDAGAAVPTWSNKQCCDIFDIAADTNRTIFSKCCAYSMNILGSGAIATLPSGSTTRFTFPDIIKRVADKQYAMVTGNGLFFTTDITASPVAWTQLGASSTPSGGFCQVQLGQSGGTPTFFAQTGGCGQTESGGAQIWKYTGTSSGATWTRIDNNGLSGGISVFAVDPTNPSRLYAANLAATGPRMVFSSDGGQSWTPDPELDALMTAGGQVVYTSSVGPTSFTGFNGYTQPSLLTFDPEDSTILVAGSRDAGVFLSTDGGADWSLVTDPFTPGSSGKPHLSNPYFAYFDHEPAGVVNVYVGTRGRGVWRLSFTIPVASAGGPYVTNEGQDVGLAATVTDSGGGPHSFAWDLDADGQYDDAFGANSTFTDVGDDGVFPVAVKVTDSDGAFDVASTTVTVNNVAPTVTGLTSNGPKPENSPITVSGVVVDPGWEDVLTGTIDWGDGSPVQPISVPPAVREQVRPDATLTFSVPHVYGDNGVFTATVCGTDDHVTTCAPIDLVVTNVNPTAEIDKAGATVINGVPTLLAHSGEPVPFSGRVRDPGSDDLFLSWDWGDGPPSPDVFVTSLVNPPLPDPFPSPSVQPRDINDVQTHVFGEACVYTVTFTARDDDGGTAVPDTIKVLIAGNAGDMENHAFWKNQYRTKPPWVHAYPASLRACLLLIVDFVSNVFNEQLDASIFEAAEDVLQPKGTVEPPRKQLQRELLTAWLNFANGAIEWTELVDTNHDGTGDTAFNVVVYTAEAVWLNAAATAGDLRTQEQILHRLNSG